MSEFNKKVAELMAFTAKFSGFRESVNKRFNKVEDDLKSIASKPQVSDSLNKRFNKVESELKNALNKDEQIAELRNEIKALNIDGITKQVDSTRRTIGESVATATGNANKAIASLHDRISKIEKVKPVELESYDDSVLLSKIEGVEKSTRKESDTLSGLLSRIEVLEKAKPKELKPYDDSKLSERVLVLEKANKPYDDSELKSRIDTLEKSNKTNDKKLNDRIDALEKLVNRISEKPAPKPSTDKIKTLENKVYELEKLSKRSFATDKDIKAESAKVSQGIKKHVVTELKAYAKLDHLHELVQTLDKDIKSLKSNDTSKDLKDLRANALKTEKAINELSAELSTIKQAFEG